MLKWLLDLIAPKLTDKQWFGSVIIKIEAGRIVHLEERRAYRPPREKAVTQ